MRMMRDREVSIGKHFDCAQNCVRVSTSFAKIRVQSEALQKKIDLEAFRIASMRSFHHKLKYLKFVEMKIICIGKYKWCIQIL
jgi:hypothetical protein